MFCFRFVKQLDKDNDCVFLVHFNFGWQNADLILSIQQTAVVILIKCDSPSKHGLKEKKKTKIAHLHQI